LIRTDNGLKKYLGIKKYNQVNTRFFNTLTFLNKNKNECCELQTFYFGRTELRKILIYYSKQKEDKRKFFKTPFSHFTTNRSIMLGISEELFLKLTKDAKYEISIEDGYKTYNSDFLLSEDSYKNLLNNEIYGNYYFKNDKLMLINLGVS